MVSERATDRATVRDRAQLFLIGSIAIALVIIGLVVIINSVLYNQAITTDQSVGDTGDAAEFEYQAESGLRALAYRLNHANRTDDRTALRSALGSNVTVLEQLLTESYVGQSAVVELGVTVDTGNDAHWGTEIVQTRDGNLTAPGSDAGDWEPVTTDGGGTRQDVGRFLLNLDLDEMAEFEETNVTIRNDTESLTVGFEVVPTTNGETLSLDVTGMANSPDCEPSDGRVLIDLVDGRSASNECSFRGLSTLEPPYSVEIEDGGNAVGAYSIVVDGETGGGNSPWWYLDTTPTRYDDCSPSEPETEPCIADAIWQGEVTLGFESNAVNVTREYPVEVYP